MDKHCRLIHNNTKLIILILGLQINLKMPLKKNKLFSFYKKYKCQSALTRYKKLKISKK